MGVKQSRRDFLKQAGTSALVLSAASFAPFGAFFPLGRAKAAGGKATVGIMAPSHCAAPYAYASVKGLFEKHGVDVELRFYQDMLAIAKDLLAGKIQIGQLISPLFLAMHSKAAIFRESGMPMVTPMFTGTNGGGIVVHKDSPATSLEDLGGMKIGSHSKLTIHYLLMISYLRSEGVKLSEPVDIQIHPLGEMIGKLKNGAIDGFIMPEPVSAVAEAKGIGKVIKLTSELWPGHPCCLMAATRSWAEEMPGAIEGVSLALLEATTFADAPGNREAFIDAITAVEAYGKMPRPVLSKAFAPGRADFASFPYHSKANLVAKLMRSIKLLPRESADQLIAEAFDTAGTRKLLAGLDIAAPAGDDREETLFGKPMTL